MQLMSRVRNAQGGDTIVEVLIVLAVLGMALGVSYATANHSLLNARQAQEHSEALEIIQAQIELLRTAPRNYPAIFDTTPTNPPNIHAYGFCMNGTAVVDLTASNLYNYSVYPNPPCVINNLYHVSIKNTDDGLDTFTVMALWPDIDGTQDSVSMNYRLHQ